VDLYPAAEPVDTGAFCNSSQLKEITLTDEELFWAGVVFAVPLLIFASFEIYGWVRRRQAKALAQRPKGPKSRGSTAF
jgi:hypothetical protein